MVRDDHTVQRVVETLFLGCVPERKQDFARLWEDYSPKFQLTEDIHGGRHIIMEAGAYRLVRYNHRVLRAFWIASHAAWEGYSAAHKTLMLNTPIDLKRFASLVSAFEAVISRDRPELERLPEGVAEPGKYADRDFDVEGRVAGELATFAVAWTLLHEIHHIQRQQEGTSADPYEADPTRRRAEELSCDRFAAQFLLDRVDAYAAAAGVLADMVRLKRQLGIYFALFGLTLLAKDNWGDTSTHPAVQKRIDAVRQEMEPFRSDLANAMAHMSFASLRTMWPAVPGPF